MSTFYSIHLVTLAWPLLHMKLKDKIIIARFLLTGAANNAGVVGMPARSAPPVPTALSRPANPMNPVNPAIQPANHFVSSPSFDDFFSDFGNSGTS